MAAALAAAESSDAMTVMKKAGPLVDSVYQGEESLCLRIPVLTDSRDMVYLRVGQSTSADAIPYFWDGLEADKLLQPVG